MKFYFCFKNYGLVVFIILIVLVVIGVGVLFFLKYVGSINVLIFRKINRECVCVYLYKYVKKFFNLDCLEV